MQVRVMSHISILIGLTMFFVSIVGLFALPIRIEPRLSQLLLATEAGPVFDAVYFALLAIGGFWMTLCYYIRIPTTFLICLVTLKLMLLNNLASAGTLVAVAAVVNLGVIIHWLAAKRRHVHQDIDDEDELGTLW